MNTSRSSYLSVLLLGLGALGCGRASESTPSPGPKAEAPAAELLAQAETALLAGEFPRVEELLGGVVSLERPSGRAELLFALCHHKRKRYPAAAPWFEAAAAAPGEWNGASSVPYFLGWCRYYLGDLEGAGESFAEHRARVPDEGDTVFGLGVVALDLGEAERAAGLFGEAIELHERALAAGATNLVPDLAKSWARLGDARSALGDLPGARHALARCVELYPPFHVAWFRLGNVLRELGDEAGAERAFAEEARWKAAAAGG